MPRLDDTVPESVELLSAILAELVGLRADVAALRGCANLPIHQTDAAIGDLLRAIAAAVGDHVFTCSDLLTRIPSPQDDTLRGAIIGAVGVLSPRRIGKLLRLHEGRNIGGLRIVRHRLERDGITWQVVASLRV